MKIPVVIRNIITLSMLSLIESIHLLIPIILVSNYLSPLKYDPAVWNKYFPFLQSAIKPEREIFFYHCWMVSALAIQAILLVVFRKDLQVDENLFRRLRAYMLNEFVFLFVLLFCVFKILLYGNPSWAWSLLYVALIFSCGVRLFWPEACKGAKLLGPCSARLSLNKWKDLLIMGGIIVFIFPTDIEAVMSRVFIQECFHHFDMVVMAPGWAYLSGLSLNTDVICQYGLGMTVAVAKIAQAMGAFNYQNVLWIFIYATIFYFVAAYLLLRFWLGNFLLSAAGILLCIKFQMFHWGIAPIIWEFLSVTVGRYFFDIFFLFFILHHLRYRTWGLMAACLCSGISLAYMTDTGVYQWVAFCVYSFFIFVERVGSEKSPWLKQIYLLGFPFISLGIALLLLSCLAGPVIFSAQFWHDALEQASLFLNGWGDLPVYQNLSDGNYFAFFMGLFIPVAYVFSMLWAGASYALDHRRRESIFVVVLCVYGLGLYHYFICRSALSSYHAVDIPFVFILCYWTRGILNRMTAKARQWASVLIFSLSLGALLTNYLFIYYPNALYLSRYNFSKEKEFYRQQFHFEEDASLIKSLTGPADRVAVISSFEVELLMEANRRPFFYYFPLIQTSFMKVDDFKGTFLYTQARVDRTLGQLNTAAPQYVFVEASLYRGQLSPALYQKYSGLTILMNYLHAHYQETAQGKYLLALKRKGS